MDEILEQPVLPGVPEPEPVEEEIDPIDNLYDNVMPDVSTGLSVPAINLAYQKMWDVEFERWVVSSAISELNIPYTALKADLAYRENKCVLEKVNPGTNPETRAAWNKEYFAEDYAKLKLIEEDMISEKVQLAEAEMVYTICRSNITRLETILKLAETSTMINMMNSGGPAPEQEPELKSAPKQTIKMPTILVPGGNIKQ